MPYTYESFANFFIDKIIKIYNEIEFNSDNNLRDKYIDTLKNLLVTRKPYQL